MGGKRCSVSGCTNSQSNSKGKDIIYHSFPKENVENREKWISACSNPSVNWNSQSASVCSDHFRSNDYTRDLRSELMNVPAKRRLRVEGIKTSLFFNFIHFIFNIFFFIYSLSNIKSSC